MKKLQTITTNNNRCKFLFIEYEKTFVSKNVPVKVTKTGTCINYELNLK